MKLQLLVLVAISISLVAHADSWDKAMQLPDCADDRPWIEKSQECEEIDWGTCDIEEDNETACDERGPKDAS